jgi:hypothetical protein
LGIILESIKFRRIKIPSELWPLYFFAIIIGIAIPKYLAEEKVITMYGYWNELSIFSGILGALAFTIAGFHILFRTDYVIMGFKNSRISKYFPNIGDQKDINTLSKIGIFMTIIGVLNIILGAWLLINWIIELLKINGFI